MRTVTVGDSLFLNLSIGLDALPYPRIFLWSKTDGTQPTNSSRAMWGYPTVSLNSVSPEDHGEYTLNAINYRFDDPNVEVGRASASFQLEVLCEQS
jgi:hypothetical protein